MAVGPQLRLGPDASAVGPSTRSLRIRQTTVVLLLFGGYAALYFCRADLSVAMPLLIGELDATASAMTMPSYAWVRSFRWAFSPTRSANYS